MANPHILTLFGDERSPIFAEGLIDAIQSILLEINASPALLQNVYFKKFLERFQASYESARRLQLKLADFDTIRVLNRGGFAEVRLVRLKSSGQVFALKVIAKGVARRSTELFYWEERDALIAARTSFFLSHLHAAFQDANSLYLVLDFYAGGDLFGLLQEYQFREIDVKFYAAEILLAIEALHKLGYAHRDIKPENVLLDWKGHVKLCDFGSCGRLDDNGNVTQSAQVGTREYVAPEVLKAMSSRALLAPYGRECDLWSYGVLLHELLVNYNPFRDNDEVTDSEVLRRIQAFKAGDLTFETEGGDHIGPDARDLVQQLMQPDATRRLGAGPDIDAGFALIRRHPFFNGVDFASLASRAPPFPPHLDSPEDHSRFETDTGNMPTAAGLARRETRANFSGEDLPFVGFSFTFAGQYAQTQQFVTSAAFETGLNHQLSSSGPVSLSLGVPGSPMTPGPTSYPQFTAQPQMAATKADVELAETQAKLRAANELADKYWQEVRTLRDSIDHMEMEDKSRSEDHKRELSQLRADVERLSGELELTKAARDEAVRASVAKTLPVSPQYEQIKAQEQQRLIDDLKAQLEAEKNRATRLQREFQESLTRSTSTTATTSDDTARLQNELAAARESERASAARMQLLLTEIEDLRVDVDRRQSEIDRLRARTKSLTAEIDQLEASKAPRRRGTVEEEGRSAQAIAEALAARNEADEARKEVDKFQQRARQLGDQLVAAKAEQERLQSTIESLEQTRSSDTQRIAQLQENLQGLQNLLEQEKHANDEALARNRDIMAELQARLLASSEIEVSALRKRVEELEHRRVESTLQKDSKFQQLVQRVIKSEGTRHTHSPGSGTDRATTLQAELGDLKKQSEKREAVSKWAQAKALTERRRLEEELKGMHARLTTLQHEKDAAVKMRDEQTQALAVMEVEVSHLRTRQTELETEINQIRSAERRRSAVFEGQFDSERLGELEVANKRLVREKAEHRQRIDELEKIVASREIHTPHPTGGLQQADSTIQRLQAQIESMEAEHQKQVRELKEKARKMSRRKQKQAPRAMPSIDEESHEDGTATPLVASGAEALWRDARDREQSSSDRPPSQSPAPWSAGVGLSSDQAAHVVHELQGVIRYIRGPDTISPFERQPSQYSTTPHSAPPSEPSGAAAQIAELRRQLSQASDTIRQHERQQVALQEQLEHARSAVDGRIHDLHKLSMYSPPSQQDLVRDLQTKLRESMLTLRRVRSQLACTTGEQGPDVSSLGESRV